MIVLWAALAAIVGQVAHEKNRQVQYWVFGEMLAGAFGGWHYAGFGLVLIACLPGSRPGLAAPSRPRAAEGAAAGASGVAAPRAASWHRRCALWAIRELVQRIARGRRLLAISVQAHGRGAARLVKTAPEQRLGAVLKDTYVLERLLGEGGMGAVYEARHTRVPRKFAVKFLHADAVHAPGVFERFQREAHIASSLGHDNIVQVMDFDRAPDGSPYMVLELLAGCDLAEHLVRSGPLSLDDTLMLLRQAAAALEAAHAQGIVHRDLKPANLFLCTRPDKPLVKILDFGISKIAHSKSIATKTGALLGTPNYMSPEQADGQPDRIDARTDVFALATIAYECLTGKLAFDGPTLMGTLFNIVHGERPKLREARPDLSESVEAALVRALAKQRDERTPSARQLVDELAGAEPAHAGVAAQPPLGVQWTVVGHPMTTGRATADTGNGPYAATVAPTVPPTGDESAGGRASSAVPLVPTTLSGAAGVRPALERATRSRGPLPLILGGAVIAAAALVSVVVLRGDGVESARDTVAETVSATAPVAAAQPSAVPEPRFAPPAEPTVAEPELVTVTLQLTPADATVTVDGEPIADNPLRLPKSEQTHTLEVSAAGYEAYAERVTATDNVKLIVTLKEKQRLSKRRSRDDAPAAEPAKPTAEPAPTKPTAEPAPTKASTKSERVNPFDKEPSSPTRPNPFDKD